MDNDHGSYDRGSSQQIDRTVDDVVPEVQFLSEQETRAYIEPGSQAGIIGGDESPGPGAFLDAIELFIYSAVLAADLVFLIGQTEMKEQKYRWKENAGCSKYHSER